jgi:hypothetical protein
MRRHAASILPHTRHNATSRAKNRGERRSKAPMTQQNKNKKQKEHNIQCCCGIQRVTCLKREKKKKKKKGMKSYLIPVRR